MYGITMWRVGREIYGQHGVNAPFVRIAAIVPS
jgi:hypothetical protein